jgi:hypothetical protein
MIDITISMFADFSMDGFWCQARVEWSAKAMRLHFALYYQSGQWLRLTGTQPPPLTGYTLGALRGFQD